MVVIPVDNNTSPLPLLVDLGGHVSGIEGGLSGELSLVHLVLVEIERAPWCHVSLDERVVGVVVDRFGNFQRIFGAGGDNVLRPRRDYLVQKLQFLQDVLEPLAGRLNCLQRVHLYVDEIFFWDIYLFFENFLFFNFLYFHTF